MKRDWKIDSLVMTALTNGQNVIRLEHYRDAHNLRNAIYTWLNRHECTACIKMSSNLKAFTITLTRVDDGPELNAGIDAQLYILEHYGRVRLTAIQADMTNAGVKFEVLQ